MTQLTADTARRLLPPRQESETKWAFGRTLLVCGSDGMSGAALLAGLAALRSGAGLVQLCSTPAVIGAARAFLPEALLLPAEAQDGFIARRAGSAILDQAQKAQALLVGCGLGLSDQGRGLLADLCTHYAGRLIIDADGLNLLAEDPTLLYKAKQPPVLTPHVGEFRRLGGTDAEAFARQYRCVLVQKGAETVITDGQSTFVLEAPNSGMAKGGSGDVLAGLTAGLCAQMPDRLLESAALAVWLHSRAGLLARAENGPRAMLPRDVIAHLPRAFLELEA